METTDLSLEVGPGDGWLLRRPSTLLFDPGANSTAAHELFRSAVSETDAVAAVKRYLVEANFEASPLAMVSWADTQVDIVVFGSLEVSTSVPAAPMLSGAGSATWVERHLGAFELSGATQVTVWAGHDSVADTDLQLGSVAAGGFRFALALPHDDESTNPVEDPFLDLPKQPEPTTESVDVAGQLVFADGQVVAAAGRMVLGRKPAGTEGAVPITVDDAQVSRSHVEVAVEGSQVVLTDLGSSNGTFVSTPDDPSPVQLEANVPHDLEPGTIVHLGSAEASFTYETEPDMSG